MILRITRPSLEFSALTFMALAGGLLAACVFLPTDLSEVDIPDTTDWWQVESLMW